MIELLVGLTFLLMLWVLGRSLIIACNANGYDWLDMPIGLGLAGLIGNFLYFGIGLAVHWIQLLFLCALFPCLVTIFRRGVRRSEWMRLLAVCGVFFLLAAPAYIGGEQYYVFRGNHWDHFNYIDQALTFRDNRYIVYRDVPVDKFLAKDVWVHGLRLINMRPAVGLIFSLTLPENRGNLHLLAFLYVTALWALAFPAVCFAWERILTAYKISEHRLLLSIVFPLAYVVGFWGQYIFDINAWSQMASLSLQLAFVFAYLGLLRKLADPPTHHDRSLTSDYIVTGLLAAGAFLYYPENAVMQAVLLLASTILWFAITRKTPPVRAVASFAFVFSTLLLIAVLPNWQATAGFVIGQIKFGSAPAPANWATYFDSYWLGLYGSTGYYTKVINFILAWGGMFFACPNYSAPLWLRGGWIAISTGVAALLLYNLIICLLVRFKENREAMFLKGFVIFGVAILFYIGISGAIWSMGRALSYLSPYIFLVICLGWIEVNNKLKITSSRKDIFNGVARRLFVGFFVISQIVFGANRLWAARDRNGIGYDNATYPSIQDISLKIEYLWTVGSGRYSACKGVHLLNYPGAIYFEYFKQKMTYLGVPYFSSLPVFTDIGGRKEVGRQQSIFTDCDVVFRRTSSGKWGVESTEPAIDGVIKFTNRSP
ncbi:hypothetical protein [Paraburkholderia dinghuensis]|uniref:Glycosyltransferase RgtA/B/C/D-like domain-containing protein n=1 Tax=Paraburkholderia dinghuensis TaxID=2305225 RepID=A0A3N6P426_9BURK|nr:hypothetical protein [Paraburkholderia dinghuensis]RQH08353.1 hypothetical protein D1Y85_04860 [Paraburkholderia dinghuensis]